MFAKLDETFKGLVSFGDNSKIHVEDKGKIVIRFKNGAHQFITNLYYVQKMSSNILSLEQLLEKGYTIYMKYLSLMLRYQNNKLIANVKILKNMMFTLNLKNEMTQYLKTCMNDPLWL